MRRLRGSLLGIDSGAEVLFSHHDNDGPMWAGTGPREIRRQVTFTEAFTDDPVVSVGIEMWDIDGKTNQRADLRAENVTPGGFELVFRTWGDTRVARIRAGWTALGPVRDDEAWDVD